MLDLGYFTIEILVW